jgi:hypothetical protein
MVATYLVAFFGICFSATAAFVLFTAVDHFDDAGK